MKSQFNEIESTIRPLARAEPRRRPGISAFWKRQFHTWHWVSSAICLVGMFLFAITGITLNHAASIEGEPIVTTEELTLPAEALEALQNVPADVEPGRAIPAEIANWLSDELGVSAAGRAIEWSELDLYIPLPRAGGDGWVSIDRATGEVLHEDTDRGWIAYLNDLHKGRDTGTTWRWFIDIFAVACIVFSLTGFLLLQLHARRRPSTWPLVGAGVIVPVLLLIFLSH